MGNIKPSEEKVYLRNYPEGAADTPLPKAKLDEFFLEVNKNQDKTGLIFAPTGQQIAIGQMIEEYNNVVKSLIGMGLQPGDNIAVSLLNVPEMVYTILAASKLGLTINMINPTADPQAIIGRIRALNPKVLIAQDKTAPLFEKIKDYIQVPYIVTAPIVNGYTNVGMEPIDKNVGWWADFIENGHFETKLIDAPYDENAPFIYTHSSGTTGPSKTIELGHDTFTHTAHMHRVAGLDIKTNDLWLSTIPALFSTGVNSSMILPMLLDFATILEPNFDREVFLNNILKFRPQAAIATKYFWKGMLDDPRFNGVDLSHLRYPVIGGEKVRRHEARHFDNFLEAHNNFYGIGNGYGQCELGGGIGNSCLNERSKGNNTIGFPYTHNTIVIKDLETGEEVGYNERGEVTTDVSTGMFRYAGMPEETARYYKDGVANLADLGYVNEKGEYFIDGRICEFIPVSSDTKLYAYEIEDVVEDIMESDPIFDEIIRDYAVHGVQDGEFEVPMLQIVVSEDHLDQEFEIIERINQAIISRIAPIKQIAGYNIRTENFPATTAGKTNLVPLKDDRDFTTSDKTPYEFGLRK